VQNARNNLHLSLALGPLGLTLISVPPLSKHVCCLWTLFHVSVLQSPPGSWFMFSFSCKGAEYQCRTAFLSGVGPLCLPDIPIRRKVGGYVNFHRGKSCLNSQEAEEL
jgi:hypothetical protein